MDWFAGAEIFAATGKVKLIPYTVITVVNDFLPESVDVTSISFIPSVSNTFEFLSHIKDVASSFIMLPDMYLFKMNFT